MATERQSPDAILAITELTGLVGDIQDDPDDPDGNWLVATGNNIDTIARVSFPTPTGNPTVGADLQELKIWVRQYDETQSGTPEVRIDLYEDGVEIRQGVLTEVPQGGLLLSFPWNANELGTADGSLVECYIYGKKSGGSPSTRNTVDIGAVEWNVVYTVGGVDVTIDAPVISVDSEASVPSPSLGVTLSPPTIAANSQGVAPDLGLDRIFGPPLIVVDSQAVTPSLSLGRTLQPPAIAIDGQAFIPSLSLDKILSSPLINVNSEASIPGLSLDRILGSPLISIDSEALIPVVSIEEGSEAEAYGYII